MTDYPEPLFRRRTPRVTEETPGPGYTCPTECDDDCDTPCHETHQIERKRMHPVDICEANVARGRPPIPASWYPSGCSCRACDEPFMPTWQEFVEGKVGEITADSPRPPVDDENWRVSTRMALCPVCGFKRCPGAADHRNRCTGSNAVGQPGSLYPAPEKPEPEFNTLDEAKQWLAEKTTEVQEGWKRRRAAFEELREVLDEEHEATAGHPLADTPIHTRGPLEGQPIVPESEEEKRERYLADRDNPEEWG